MPHYLGQVRDSHNSGSDQIVIHIQDAHCNYACQKRIAEIIDYLNKGYEINTINLEGGSGEYDLSIFTEIDDTEIRENVANYFVKEGLLSGAEYFAVNDPAKINVWGVENVDLYLNNLNAYRVTLPHKDQVDKYLLELKVVIDKLKENIFNEKLMEMSIKYAKYQSGEIEFKDYLKFLTVNAALNSVNIENYPNIQVLDQTMQQESSLDFKKANTERDLLIEDLKDMLSKSEFKKLLNRTIEFKNKHISQEDYYSYLFQKANLVGIDLSHYPNLQKYCTYVSSYGAANKSSVMKEMSALEENIKDVLFENDVQRELEDLSNNLILLKNIFELKISRDDWEDYKSKSTELSFQNYKTFINKEAPKYKIKPNLSRGIDRLDMWREEMENFFKLSFERDKAFIENLSLPKPPSSRKITLLVTGGFHTENLCQLFKENNISYISILPTFKTHKDLENPYFQLLSGGKSTTVQALLNDMSTIALWSDYSAHAGEVSGEELVKARELMVLLVTASLSNDKLPKKEQIKEITVKVEDGVRIYTLDKEKADAEGFELVSGATIAEKEVYAKTITGEKKPEERLPVDRDFADKQGEGEDEEDAAPTSEKEVRTAISEWTPILYSVGNKLGNTRYATILVGPLSSQIMETSQYGVKVGESFNLGLRRSFSEKGQGFQFALLAANVIFLIFALLSAILLPRCTTLFTISTWGVIMFSLEWFLKINIFIISLSAIVRGVVPFFVQVAQDISGRFVFGDIEKFFGKNPDGFLDAISSRDVVIDISAPEKGQVQTVHIITRRGIYEKIPLFLSPRIRMQVVGEGGGANIYTFPGYKGAIKVSKGHVGTNEQLQREIEMISGLGSIPGIAHYAGRGNKNGNPYLVLNAVANAVDLKKLITQKQISFDRALELFIEAATILSRVHAKGYLHMDVKSENFIVGQEGKASLQLIDFAETQSSEDKENPDYNDYIAFQRMLREYFYKPFEQRIQAIRSSGDGFFTAPSVSNAWEQEVSMDMILEELESLKRGAEEEEVELDVERSEHSEMTVGAMSRGQMKELGLRADPLNEDTEELVTDSLKRDLVSLAEYGEVDEELLREHNIRAIVSHRSLGKASAYHFKPSEEGFPPSTKYDYIIVLNSLNTDEVNEEARFHEAREIYWMSKTWEDGSGVTQHEAHVLASAEQANIFSKNRLTPYHLLQLENMEVQQLRKIVGENETKRAWHHEILERANTSFGEGINVDEARDYERRLYSEAERFLNSFNLDRALVSRMRSSSERENYLKTKNVFSYDIGEKKIFYFGASRFECFDGSEKLVELSSDRSDRKWNDEFLELSVELNKLRGEIIEALVRQYPYIIEDQYIREDYERYRSGRREYGSTLLSWMKKAVKEKNRNETFDSIQELETKLKKGLRIFKDVVQNANKNPGAIRAVAESRDILTRRVLDALERTGEQTVNVYVSNQRAAGVFGRAMLVARGITAAAEEVHVNVYVLGGSTSPDGFSFASGTESKINVMPISRTELLRGNLHKSAHVHIGVSHHVDFVDSNDVVFDMSPLPNVQGHTYDSVRYYSAPTNNDLQSPYGTLPMDRGLMKRRQKKDVKGMPELIRDRKDWLRGNLENRQFRTLNQEGEKEGWAPENAIWSWGYFQDREKFLEEVDVMCQAFSKDNLEKLPFVENGQQLLIHLIPGKHISGGFDHRELINRGISVIDEYGNLWPSIYGKDVPITVVLHKGINNTSFRSLQSELSGTLKRNKEDSFWIDFPVFTTGTGSWLEAISSSAISLHDGYDTNPNSKRRILIPTIIRMLALEDKEGKKSWDEIESEATVLVDDYIMGSNPDPTKYFQMEEWTERARKYAEVMFRFNMNDDILREVAKSTGAQFEDKRDLEESEADRAFSQPETSSSGSGVQAFYEQMETVPRAARDRAYSVEDIGRMGGAIIHAFAYKQSFSDNVITVVNRNSDWRDRLKILLASSSQISTSSVNAHRGEINSDAFLFKRLGLLLKGGTIEDAFPRDGFSQVDGNERFFGRDSVGEKLPAMTEEYLRDNVLERRIPDDTVRSSAAGIHSRRVYLNELIISNPEYAGLVLCLDNYPGREEDLPIEQIHAASVELALPVYVIKNGQIYRSIYNESKTAYEPYGSIIDPNDLDALNAYNPSPRLSDIKTYLEDKAASIFDFRVFDFPDWNANFSMDRAIKFFLKLNYQEILKKISSGEELVVYTGNEKLILRMDEIISPEGDQTRTLIVDMYDKKTGKKMGGFTYGERNAEADLKTGHRISTASGMEGIEYSFLNLQEVDGVMLPQDPTSLSVYFMGNEGFLETMKRQISGLKAYIDRTLKNTDPENRARTEWELKKRLNSMESYVYGFGLAALDLGSSDVYARVREVIGAEAFERYESVVKKRFDGNRTNPFKISLGDLNIPLRDVPGESTIQPPSQRTASNVKELLIANLPSEEQEMMRLNIRAVEAVLTDELIVDYWDIIKELSRKHDPEKAERGGYYANALSELSLRMFDVDRNNLHDIYGASMDEILFFLGGIIFGGEEFSTLMGENENFDNLKTVKQITGENDFSTAKNSDAILSNLLEKTARLKTEDSGYETEEEKKERVREIIRFNLKEFAATGRPSYENVLDQKILLLFERFSRDVIYAFGRDAWERLQLLKMDYVEIQHKYIFDMSATLTDSQLVAKRKEFEQLNMEIEKFFGIDEVPGVLLGTSSESTADKEDSEAKVKSRQTATIDAYNNYDTRALNTITLVGIPEGEDSTNFYSLSNAINRILGKKGHGDRNARQIQTFIISKDPDKTKESRKEALKKAIEERDRLTKLTGRKVIIVDFVPQMESIGVTLAEEAQAQYETEYPDVVFAVPDAYTDLDSVDIHARDALARLISFHENTSKENQGNAFGQIEKFLGRISDLDLAELAAATGKDQISTLADLLSSLILQPLGILKIWENIEQMNQAYEEVQRSL